MSHFRFGLNASMRLDFFLRKTWAQSWNKKLSRRRFARAPTKIFYAKGCILKVWGCSICSFRLHSHPWMENLKKCALWLFTQIGLWSLFGWFIERLTSIICTCRIVNRVFHRQYSNPYRSIRCYLHMKIRIYVAWLYSMSIEHR